MTKLMAIVNLNDNSFVETSRMGSKSVEEVIERIDSLLHEGASIIDLGACSTAPGNEIISQEEEWKRFSRFLPEIFRSFPDTTFSLDTFYSSTVRKALSLGRRFIVNDISAGEDDPEMLPLVASEGLTYIAMDRTNDPYSFFQGFARQAERIGISDWILDPGFGFGKTIEENWKIMDSLERFHDFGREVLVAISRKRMIHVPLGLRPESCAEQSVAAEAASAAKGADIIRTHDVALLSSKLSLSSRHSS